MTPQRKKEYLLAQAQFFKGERCIFPGATVLKAAYDKEMQNLGSGCSRCKKNAIKRRYLVKIQRIFELPFPSNE